jgi:hypothetical protein
LIPKIFKNGLTFQSFEYERNLMKYLHIYYLYSVIFEKHNKKNPERKKMTLAHETMWSRS